MSYEVILPHFEGPFDLLLFFIKRDELDIYDIPISKVTEDFLNYIHQLEKMKIEIASEFILMVATLMRIKSKMLLPRPELNELGEEIDPREELVQHVLAYKKYKSVVPLLVEMEENQLKRHKRPQAVEELKSIAKLNGVETELAHLDLFKIMKTYQKLLLRHQEVENKPTHQVVPYPYTIDDQKKIILEKIYSQKKVSFQDLINTHTDKIILIFNFLSILELLQSGKINIVIGNGYNNFWISNKLKSK